MKSRARKIFVVLSIACLLSGLQPLASASQLIRGGPLVARGTEVEGGGSMTADEIRAEIVRTGYAVYYTLYEYPGITTVLPNGMELDLITDLGVGLDAWSRSIGARENQGPLQIVKGRSLDIEGRKDVDARTAMLRKETEFRGDRWETRRETPAGRLINRRLVIHELLVRAQAEKSLTYDVTDQVIALLGKRSPLGATSQLAGTIRGEIEDLKTNAKSLDQLQSGNFKCEVISTRRPDRQGQLSLDVPDFEHIGLQKLGGNSPVNVDLKIERGQGLRSLLVLSSEKLDFRGEPVTASRAMLPHREGNAWVQVSRASAVERSAETLVSLWVDRQGGIFLEWSRFGRISPELTNLEETLNPTTLSQFPGALLFPGQRTALAVGYCRAI